MSEHNADLEVVWSAAIADIPATELTGRNRALLKMTKPVGLMGTTALIAAPDNFTQNMIETKLRPILNKVLSATLDKDVQIAVTVDSSMLQETRPTQPDAPEPVSSSSTPDLPVLTPVADADPLPGPIAHDGPTRSSLRPQYAAAPSSNDDLWISRGRLNPKYTFENFVRGPSNRLAFAAASAVAEAPAKAYNPLFIYGGSGLGKTHLLHAIGNYAEQVFPEIRVLYVSSEEFTNDFINAIANAGRGEGDQREQFRKRYREVDILMIDDIQFLERAEQTQEEFFHTFNTLHNANKQIVITSDRTPKELTTLEDRLRSRFAGGLTPDIQSPDFETRLAILRNKAAQEGLTVSPEVLELLATKIQSNIRELEGALIRVSAYASLTGQGVDLEIAQHVIKDLVPENETPHISAGSIMQQVCTYYDVSIDDLCGRNRSKTLVMPRQIAMYLCRELTDLSLPRIGQQFGGKDHTTVMHAVKKVTNEMKEKRHIYNQVVELTSRIKSEGRQ
ncbi:chromosomal replication initiator protein DnaA [Blastococcus sp. Marseille-P5729]|uniref:chromosomal replication initiator protein DnaA n=1 Tax=Blastococcus sp. Marseille-P5729 TaxID=2086582 RepID=UPI000D0E64B3|nr:chromosomal replication initiator protein DnaA [Blastococcus sp. Marseille-P5729]